MGNKYLDLDASMDVLMRHFNLEPVYYTVPDINAVDEIQDQRDDGAVKTKLLTALRDSIKVASVKAQVPEYWFIFDSGHETNEQLQNIHRKTNDAMMVLGTQEMETKAWVPVTAPDKAGNEVLSAGAFAGENPGVFHGVGLDEAIIVATKYVAAKMETAGFPGFDFDWNNQ